MRKENLRFVLIDIPILLGTCALLFGTSYLFKHFTPQNWPYILLVFILTAVLASISTIIPARRSGESRQHRVADRIMYTTLWVGQLTMIGYGLVSFLQGQIRSGAILTGLGVIALIAGKVGVFIWTVALLPAVQALPGVVSGYYITKWLDRIRKRKTTSEPPPPPTTPGKPT